jgi:hypothetical protein
MTVIGGGDAHGCRRRHADLRFDLHFDLRLDLARFGVRLCFLRLRLDAFDLRDRLVRVFDLRRAASAHGLDLMHFYFWCRTFLLAHHQNCNVQTKATAPDNFAFCVFAWA